MYHRYHVFVAAHSPLVASLFCSLVPAVLGCRGITCKLLLASSSTASSSCIRCCCCFTKQQTHQRSVLVKVLVRTAGLGDIFEGSGGDNSVGAWRRGKVKRYFR